MADGYHGDDGNKFHRSGRGQRFGPRFGAGDTIGCGLDFSDLLMGSPEPTGSAAAARLPAAKLFYTRNGEMIGNHAL